MDLHDSFEKQNNDLLFLGLILATNLIVANVFEDHFRFTSTNVLGLAAVFIALAGMYFKRPLADKIILVLAYAMVIFPYNFPRERVSAHLLFA